MEGRKAPLRATAKGDPVPMSWKRPWPDGVADGRLLWEGSRAYKSEEGHFPGGCSQEAVRMRSHRENSGVNSRADRELWHLHSCYFLEEKRSSS